MNAEALPELGRLAITRRIGERVRIGDWMIQVKSISHGEVRLVITAPRDVPIVRCELEQEP
jgi:carbon storage regulator CsrA